MNKTETLNEIIENINKIDNKDFNVYFYVLDTKGNPSGMLSYIYQLAKILASMKYKVTMLHNEEDFIGPFDWIEGDYSDLPHKNIEKDNVKVNICDFLFIPELFTNVMLQTKKLKCKKIVLIQNYKFLLDFMPIGARFSDMNINHAITTTPELRDRIQSLFPELQIKVIPPSIKNIFNDKEENHKQAQGLIINIVSKEQTDVKQIIKPFYLKYPMYKWVSFRDLRGVSQEVFAKALKESPLTIWVDEDTNFGFSGIEAIKCGNIVLSKLPKKPSGWMLSHTLDGQTTFSDYCIWFDDMDELPDKIASIVESWIFDSIPEEIYDKSKTIENLYSLDDQIHFIKEECVDGLFQQRRNEFAEIKKMIENNTIKFE